MTTTKTPIDRLRALVDGERMSANAAEWLEALDGDELRSLADLLNEAADAIEEASQAVETWEGAEGREERAEAKDEALTAIQAAIDFVEVDLADATVPEYLTLGEGSGA